MFLQSERDSVAYFSVRSLYLQAKVQSMAIEQKNKHPQCFFLHFSCVQFGNVVQRLGAHTFPHCIHVCAVCMFQFTVKIT